MTAAEYCFIDTNVLLTASDKDRPNHTAAVHFLESGLRGEKRLFTNGQVFREYLVVATRPVENNGVGLSPNDALSNLHTFSASIQLLNESQAVAQKLHKLAADYQLKGKRIHDANIVATMLEKRSYEYHSLSDTLRNELKKRGHVEKIDSRFMERKGLEKLVSFLIDIIVLRK